MMCKVQRLFVVWLFALNREPLLIWLPNLLQLLDYPVIADAFRKSSATLPSSAAVERLFSAAAQVRFSLRDVVEWHDTLDRLLFSGVAGRGVQGSGPPLSLKGSSM